MQKLVTDVHLIYVDVESPLGFLADVFSSIENVRLYLSIMSSDVFV